MNLQEEYKNIISTLSENMFRDFVKEYVKAYWKTDEVESKQSLRAVLRTLIKIYTFAPNFKFGTK